MFIITHADYAEFAEFAFSKCHLKHSYGKNGDSGKLSLAISLLCYFRYSRMKISRKGAKIAKDLEKA